MEENTAAIECLILFYINTKHLLKTKQLDERVFLDQMIRHCKESGFDGYSNEEIRNTWHNVLLKFSEMKKNGTVEEKECWKYYEILDSCYESSDFHNGVYPKFSEEMVWFLIECFLKRRGLEKTQKRNTMLNEIHKDFLHSGYLYVTRQDIENKWKYLNVKYDKLKDDPDAFDKCPYLQALTGFREKEDKCFVKMIFTRELTEILIERFTVKKITCVIHGYDSAQVLSEIQSEFRDLGFDFEQEDIKEKWRKLTTIYSFIKAKGKDDSSWIYFNAMKEHFKDAFLFEFGRLSSEVSFKGDDNTFKPLSRPRSKSMSTDSRLNLSSDQIKANLIVNIEQLDKNKLSPTSKRKLDDNIVPANKRKLSTKRANNSTRDSSVSPKKSKRRSKSKENAEVKENERSESIKENGKSSNETNTNKIAEPILQARDSISVKRNTQLTRLTIDRNGNQERRSSTELGSPGSKVHIINIDQSDIDKKSGNLTINLPSITKQFSDNEFLPLKKRLRLDGQLGDKHPDDASEIKDGFLGFPAEEVAETRKRLKSDSSECKRLTEEEMAEIMERINEDNSEKYGINDDLPADNTNYFKPGFNYKYLGPYNNFNQPCLIIPKEEHQDKVPLQNYNSTNPITPPPVLLLVIKVDGTNSLPKDESMNEMKQELEKRFKDSPDKSKPGQSNSNSKAPHINNGSSKGGVKNPASGKTKNCTITHNKNMIVPSVEVTNTDAKDLFLEYNLDKVTVKLASPGGANCAIEDVGLLSIESEEEVKTTQTSDIHIKDALVNLSSPIGQNGRIALNEEVVVAQNVTTNDKEEISIHTSNDECTNAIVNISVQTLHSPKKNEGYPTSPETIPDVSHEHNTTVPPVIQQADVPKTIRLPVSGGGKVKEIFISPQELKKIAQLKPENFKLKKNPARPIDDGNAPKGHLESNATPKKPPPKIKFMSHVIRPPTGDGSVSNKPEKAPPNPRSKANNSLSNSNTIDLTLDDNQIMLPPSTSFATPSKFPGTNNSSSAISKNAKNEEFENESVFSEAVGDDDGLKDNLLATVIDFQEQNNQEFVEIKNLMKQNNLLQRETNRLLRLMLEKM